MKIINIEAEQLRSMKNKEGLVIQDCGSELQEMADEINDMLTEADILKNGSRFEKCYVFENENASCMLLPFENVRLDIGKLAMWRLQTHEQFGGKWLSDYVPNRLGGFVTEQKKPKCQLIGQDGNVFNLMGIASKTLKENNMTNEAKEMCSRITASGSYDEALCIISEYVEVTSIDEYEEETEELGMEMI